MTTLLCSAGLFVCSLFVGDVDARRSSTDLGIDAVGGPGTAFVEAVENSSVVPNSTNSAALPYCATSSTGPTHPPELLAVSSCAGIAPRRGLGGLFVRGPPSAGRVIAI